MTHSISIVYYYRQLLIGEPMRQLNAWARIIGYFSPHTQQRAIMSYIEKYRKVQHAIADAAVKSGRNPEDITIIVVSKTFFPSAIQQAINDGIRIFGENRVQEAKTKIPQLKGDFSFHLVGHLQSNKSKDAVRLFSLIHSIDKLSTAQKVDRDAAAIGKTQKILVEVNTSGETSKSGVNPEETRALCGEILLLKNIELLGLMTVGPLTEDRDAIRRSFSLLRTLLGDVNSRLGTSLRELSMGMSSDYTLAVEEGASMVRIGTAIFGERIYGYGPA